MNALISLRTALRLARILSTYNLFDNAVEKINMGGEKKGKGERNFANFKSSNNIKKTFSNFIKSCEISFPFSPFPPLLKKLNYQIIHVVTFFPELFSHYNTSNNVIVANIDVDRNNKY